MLDSDKATAYIGSMSTERRSHECSACDGIGSVDGPCDECPNKHGYVECAGCLGSGRIPEPTEAELRRDAMADAETLLGAQSRKASSNVGKAVLYGQSVARWIGADKAAEQAVLAARAAFRAVPALRGDR